MKNILVTTSLAGLLAVAPIAAGQNTPDSREKSEQKSTSALSHTVRFKAPAGTLPATRHVQIDGFDAAVLPNGRLVTPAGVEANVGAPKPFGLALSPDGKTLATINSGAGPFSITLITGLTTDTPKTQLIVVNATFLGVTFSSDSSKFFASGGENGNIWVGSVATAKIVGSVNLNGAIHPLNGPLDPTNDPPGRFKGAFPGNLILSKDGRYLFVVDQAGFRVHMVDTSKIITGVDGNGFVTEPNNFEAVVGSVPAGRYTFGIGLSLDGKTLFAANPGVFQYKSLRPDSPTGDPNIDFPLGYPGAGYPEETENDRIINIKKVDPRNLPDTLSIPDGIQVGYIKQDRTYVVPGLGSPNAPESSSVFVYDVSNPESLPILKGIVKTGPKIGEVENQIKSDGGSHPNAVVSTSQAIFIANGNNDSISIVDPKTLKETERVSLEVVRGIGTRIKGVQPMWLTLSPDLHYLYVAEAGINAVGVLSVQGEDLKLLGHIPVGTTPSAVRVSNDGKILYVTNARGRGAGPNNDLPPDNLGSPKFSDLGTVNILPVPDEAKLAMYTQRVLLNNGFVDIARREEADQDEDDKGNKNPIPTKSGEASAQIKHIIFINKENATHDLLLGDITETRKGVQVNGEPKFSLGQAASPNHHELALRFAFSDNFFLEPSVSSDGHRWLADNYPPELEDTHWPASYGGEKNDAGDDPNVFENYPGRLGFTDANSSAEPNDYDQHGGIFLHLARNGKTFVNFGNAYEFAIVDESNATDPTGIRNHVNVPMEKIVRDNSDHLFPEFNTHIPDAPLAEDPTRFSRFGRFKQVFEAHYVNRKAGTCSLPSYVDLYYPNDHGGGSLDIFPNGPDWSFERFVQDNDDALGRTVELISNSPCWKDTVIFVVEDDTQNGFDHVDGSRSIFLAISPWVKHEYLGKQHYSLGSVFKTVNLILGIPPLNQYDAAATSMRDLFTAKPDFSKYQTAPIQFAKGASPAWIQATKGIDFSNPDADRDKLLQAIAKSEGLPRTAAPSAKPVGK